MDSDSKEENCYNCNVTGHSDQSSDSEVDEYSTDFAAQLKKKRKQVLEKDSVASFANSLRKHRETLVGTWEEQQTATTTTTTTTTTTIMNSADSSIGDHLTMNGSDDVVQEIDTDGDFGEFNDVTPELMTQANDTTTESMLHGNVDHDKVMTSITGEQEESSMDLKSPTSDPVEVQVEGEKNVELDDEDNFFGDFETTLESAATANITAEPLGQPVIAPMTLTDDEDDFFGAFDSVTPMSENIQSEPTDAGKAEETNGLDSESQEKVDLSPFPTEESLEAKIVLTTDELSQTAKVIGETHTEPEPMAIDTTFIDPEEKDRTNDSVNDKVEETIESSGAEAILLETQINSDMDDDEFGEFDDCVILQSEVQTTDMSYADRIENASGENINQQQVDEQNENIEEVKTSFSAPGKENDDEAPMEFSSAVDHNFGDFDGVTSQPQEISANECDSEAPPNQSLEYSEELRGFGTTSSREETVSAKTDDNDDFGSFESHPIPPKPSPGSIENQHLEDVGGSPIEERIGGNGDDFGGFDSVSTSKAEEAGNDEVGGSDGPTPQLEQSIETADNDFVASDGPATQSQRQASLEEQGDDFDAFDGPTTQSQRNSDKTSPDDEDFGDFGGTSVEVQQQGQEDEPSDDFGVFNEPSTEQFQDLDKADDTDDDFGDFDGPSSQPHQPSSGDVDDDFGDFDSAPPVQHQSIETNNDEDDFGEFDTAAGPGSKSDEIGLSDEGIDRFGDFGSSSLEAKTSAGDEDDFGRFEDMATESITPLAPVGEIGDKARTFFATMQSKYPFPEIEEGDNETFTIEASVAAIIENLTGEVQNFDGSMPFHGLFSALPLIPTKEEKQNLIIDGDGWSPSQPFAYPIGGFRAPDQHEYEMERIRRSAIACTKVPEVLPIELPTGTNDTPLDTASPVAARRGTFQSSNGDAPHLPTLGYATPIDASQTNGDKVTSLLSRIPDLGFMLKSTLVLPKK
ncbi:hypothetical protein IV203_005805 [Nitzschia inconspicua]|uniref:Aftiphilin n=1 Tax=Nitzschia inconspicua TaxID=303405 RepID=A0A9K3PH98_9STRA|nr:hypothetical protein IV203_005805 [Nitzschia inconspicua]